jgi:N-acetyl-anhydromuramyl-L-alanine amidase AmpD
MPSRFSPPLPLLAAALLLAFATPAVAQPVPLLTREGWGAAPAAAPMVAHRPERITVHHTATLQRPERPTGEKLHALQRFAQSEALLADGGVKPAWADFPYHFYIAADGTVAEGRELGFAGDSNTPYDTRGHIQIVLEGNFEAEWVTGAQYRSLAALTHALASEWEVPPDRVAGHLDHAPGTLCPGRGLYPLLGWLREGLPPAVSRAAGSAR